MTDRLRIGFVGVGGMGIANYHANEFARDPRAEIVACCDIKPEALATFGERSHVAARYTDYEEMLRDAALDIVVVCTNETWHSRMTILAAEYGPKAILCEKPMAMTLGEANEMLEACESRGILLVIGHQRRYMPQYARAKELLRDGAIGDLLQINATGHVGASLHVDGTHTIDLVRFYVDDDPAEWIIGQVDARTHRIGWGHVLEDAAIAVVRFRGGIRAFLTFGGHISPRKEPLGDGNPFHYHRIVLHGARGRIEIGGDSSTEGQPLLRLVRGDRQEDVALASGWHHDLSPQRDLLDALEDGHVHPLNGENGRAALEILLAIHESARLRRLVVFPLQNHGNPLEMMLEED